jgi:hypothetical protein
MARCAEHRQKQEVAATTMVAALDRDVACAFASGISEKSWLAFA